MTREQMIATLQLLGWTMWIDEDRDIRCRKVGYQWFWWHAPDSYWVSSITHVWFDDGKQPLGWDDVPGIAQLYWCVMKDMEGLGHVD